MRENDENSPAQNAVPAADGIAIGADGKIHFPRVIVGGLPVAVLDRKRTARLTVATALSRRGSGRPCAFFTTTNGQVVSLCASRTDVKRMFERADLISADGMSVVLASRLGPGPQLPERVATTDAFHDVARLAGRAGLSFFFLGASEEVNRLAVARVRQTYPGVKIAGRHQMAEATIFAPEAGYGYAEVAVAPNRWEKALAVAGFIVLLETFRTGLAAGASDRGDGSTLFQLVSGLIYLSGIAALLLRGVPAWALRVLVRCWPLDFLLVLPLMSTAWSDAPSQTLRRAVALLLSSSFAFFLLVRFDLRTFFNLLAVAFGVYVVVGVLAAGLP